MDKKTNFIKAMTYDYPTEIPVGIHFLPAALKKYPDEILSIVQKYPDLFGDIDDYMYDLINWHHLPARINQMNGAVSGQTLKRVWRLM